MIRWLTLLGIRSRLAPIDARSLAIAADYKEQRTRPPPSPTFSELIAAFPDVSCHDSPTLPTHQPSQSPPLPIANPPLRPTSSDTSWATLPAQSWTAWLRAPTVRGTHGMRKMGRVPAATNRCPLGAQGRATSRVAADRGTNEQSTATRSIACASDS